MMYGGQAINKRFMLNLDSEFSPHTFTPDQAFEVYCESGRAKKPSKFTVRKELSVAYKAGVLERVAPATYRCVQKAIDDLWRTE